MRLEEQIAKLDTRTRKQNIAVSRRPFFETADQVVAAMHNLHREQDPVLQWRSP